MAVDFAGEPLTIGAGLAYSNGVGGSLREGNASYYAERMPDVSQTLHFVIETIRQGPRDPRLAEYVMAVPSFSVALTTSTSPFSIT